MTENTIFLRDLVSVFWKILGAQNVVIYGILVANATMTIDLSSMAILLPYSPTTGNSIMATSLKMSAVVHMQSLRSCASAKDFKLKASGVKSKDRVNGSYLILSRETAIGAQIEHVEASRRRDTD